MATEHDIKFKASVDMSQANSQIQNAAKKFNLNVVRQAVHMFGEQLTNLSEAAGFSEFSNSIKTATSTIENSIRAYNALGVAGGAAAAALTLLTEAFIATSKDMEEQREVLSRAFKRRDTEENEKAKSELSLQFLEGDDNVRNALYQSLLDEATDYQSAIDEANSIIDEAREKMKNSLDPTEITELQKTIAAQDALVGVWQKELNLINDVLKEYDDILNSEAEEAAKRAADEAQLEEEIIKEKEKELKKLQENRQRSLDIFAQFDRSQDLKNLTDALRGNDPTAKAAASDVITSELQKWTQIVEDFRQQLEEGVQIDNNALNEALSNFRVFQDLAESIQEDDKKDQAKALEKTLNAVSNLAAIGGQEAAGVKAQTNDYIKNIEYYVRKISEEGMNTGVIL